jgi:large conductance mechanosensitive channel
MNRLLSTPLKESHLLAFIFAAAAGSAMYSVTSAIVAGAVLPIVDTIFGVELRTATIDLGEAGPQDDIFVSVILSSLVAATVVLGSLALILRRNWERDVASTAVCPYCLSSVPAEATRCAYCTAELPFEEEPV